MSDRRQGFANKKAPGLVSERHTGVALGRDKEVIDTEDKRRKKPAEAAPAVEEKAAPQQQPQAPPPPPPPKPDAAYDRFHKWSRGYVTVSKDHNAGEDPIPNPGYRSAAAAFSNIQDAVNFAANTLVPKLGNKWERVVVEIHGGVYEEDVTITGTWTGGSGPLNRVDIIGFGMPVILGKLTLDATVDKIFISGIEVFKDYFSDSRGPWDDNTSVTVMDGLPLVDSDMYWGSDTAPVQFHDCVFWADTFYGVDFQKPVYCNRVVFRTSQPYQNAFPIVRCRVSQHVETLHVRLTEFDQCRIIAGQTLDVLPDSLWDRGFALQVEGTDALGMIHSTEVSPPYLGINRSGVVLRDTTIVGFEQCRWWNLAHIDCDCIGGYRVADGANGNVFCLALSNAVMPALTADANVYFDDCEINSRYIVQLDRTPVAGPPGGVPSAWIRACEHFLPPLAIAAGDAIIDNNLLGQSHVTNSFTPRGQWLTAGAISVTNSPVNVPAVDAQPPFMML